MNNLIPTWPLGKGQTLTSHVRPLLPHHLLAEAAINTSSQTLANDSVEITCTLLRQARRSSDLSQVSHTIAE